jgi:urea transporter
LILAGVFLASRNAGIMMVISGLIGAGMAILLGAPYGLVAFGLFGYNSILTGMAFWSGPFVKSNKVTFFISIFGAAVTAVVWMAMAHLTGDMFILNGLQ